MMPGYFTDEQTRAIVQDTYARARSESVAVAESLYGAEELAALPRGAVELALGVGHPVRFARLAASETVLDLGCGAGIDTLLAALAVGPRGKAVGLDMTPEMIDRARTHASLAGVTQVEILHGFMEEIPLPDASVDVIVSNGVLNLSARKSRAIAEMTRVLRPGGRLAIADLVLTERLPEEVLKSPAALAG
jgi:SAM-dependent methyltransferase